MQRLITLLLLALVCAAQTPTAPTEPAKNKPAEPQKAPEPPKVTKAKHESKIKAIADDRSELVIWKTNMQGVPVPGDVIKLSVTDQVWKDALKNWRAQDLAVVSYDETTATTQGPPPGVTLTRTLTNISPRLASDVRASDFKWALYVSLGVGLVLWFFLRRFVLGEDGFYSNSKLQMAIWFTIVIVGYLSTLFVRGLDYGAVQIPQNLLMLSGLSVISFGGAKLVTQGKVDAAKTKAAEEVTAKEKLAGDSDAAARAAASAAAGAQGTPEAASKEQLAVEADAKAKNAAKVADDAKGAAPASDAVRKDTARPNMARDLFTDNNGKADLADFQMIVITFLAAAVYVIQLDRFIPLIEMRYFVSLPDVDNTLLASFGLGQGAYLIKKAVGGINQ